MIDDGTDGNMPHDVAVAIRNTIHKRQVIITVPIREWLGRSARFTFEAIGIPLDAKVIDTRTNQMDRTVDVKLAHGSFPFVPDREKIPKWEDVMADVIGKTEVTSTMTRGKIDTTPEDPQLTWHGRLVAERHELDQKIEQLSAFIKSDRFGGIEKAARSLMVRQLRSMREYSNVLTQRIELPD